MSKSELQVSQKAQGEQEADSVFDFLYHDSRRVGSLLSQFDANGLLKGVTQSDGVKKGTRRGYKFGLGGNLPSLGGANFDLERGPAEEGASSTELSYDPFWANAREFLDAITARDMLHRELSQAGIGQIVLISGRIVLFDVATLRPAWNLPSIKAKIREGEATPPSNRKNQLKNQ